MNFARLRLRLPATRSLAGAARFATLACLLLPSTALAGRHFIAGQVVDRNGEPVDRAVVSLTPGRVELVTDREGRFLIDYLRDDDGERIKLSKKTDYQLEVFKPGFHAETRSFFYKKGSMELKAFTMVEETIDIRDEGENLDPELFSEQTSNTGATYEGQ